MRDRLDRLLPQPLPLVEMGWAIYADYQRALTYRGAVDFDDLIRLALQALQLDPEFLQRLQVRWPFILEDEAQDSSRLQEEILRLLVGPVGNWVRVGDPNQAIYETFTTASPHFLRDFRFPQSYAPLPGPYPDNLWLTYVFACQNVTGMAQLQEMCDHARLGDAERLPGEALPHKIREALRIAQRNDKLTLVHEWLGRLKPQQGLQRPRQRRRRS